MSKDQKSKVCKYQELLTNVDSTKLDQISYQVKDTKFALKAAINTQEHRVNEFKGSLINLRASYPLDINALIKAKANLKVAEMTLESAIEEYTFLFNEEYSE